MSRVLVVAMLALSFSTGVLDAATYLGLHGVFTANMTGNVIFVSLGLAGHADVAWQRALLALGGFALGSAAGGLLVRTGTWRGESGAGAVVSVVLVAVVLGATAAALGLGSQDSLLLDGSTVALALAMGVQAVAARRVGVGDVTTVVVTSTLAALAGENALTGRKVDARTTARRALAVGTMVLGAAVGALLVLVSVSVAVAASCVVTAVVAAALVHHRRSLI